MTQLEASNSYKVSIVIPVYNTENFLDRCIHSVLAQTLSDIEIILVDDGSTDQSGKLCDDYATTYKDRIFVIHQSNAGLTNAWKTGSKFAHGQYIGYLDSDDYILPDMFEKLYTKIKETDADIACCGLHHIYEDHSHKEWDDQMMLPMDTLNPIDLKEVLFPTLINDGSFMGRRLHPNRVTKLVRASLVKSNLPLCHDEVSIGEDFQFSLCMFLDAKKVVILKDYFPYYYYMNSSSMTMKYDENYMQKICIMKDNLLRISKQKGTYDFSVQIQNDFLCLTILQLKGSIYKRKSLPYSVLKKDMRKICQDQAVKEALMQYQMPRITIAERVFILLMKTHQYFLIYVLIRLYFK